MVSKSTSEKSTDDKITDLLNSGTRVPDRLLVDLLVRMLRRAAYQCMHNEGGLAFSNPAELLADLLAGNDERVDVLARGNGRRYECPTRVTRLIAEDVCDQMGFMDKGRSFFPEDPDGF